MPRKNEKCAATLVLIRPDAMSVSGKKDIAAWLREQAKNLVKDGHLYDKRFTARYMYREAKSGKLG